MKTVAIITARGGSKRIPGKNIKNFMGKPMLAYAIEAALESGIFDNVMVSTDSEEIAEVARKYGAEVPFMRSERTSNDHAVTFDVLDEVIKEYKNRGVTFDVLCCIYPCVPFLKASTLKAAYEQMQGHSACVPVCKYPVPVEWAMKIENDRLVPNDREAQNIRSQDLTPKYFDVGMFYFCTVDGIYEHNSPFPDDSTAYVIDEAECMDIDTADDWRIAEIKYKIIKG
ncbi:MAG: pseudaminic acid cytidylyltransferase [Lentisphaeria bacterium]|nr:pseudaminic acid cytidylyltransferase [Lentisphaeria bacterium]